MPARSTAKGSSSARTASRSCSEASAETLDALLAEIGRCRVCVDAPRGAPLPHIPRPVLRVSATARIAIFSQAPGARVHASGLPFTDPSGDRLRAWMGIGKAEFYDVSRVAILPMGLCFPGYDAKGADRPPRPECTPLWRSRVLAHLDRLELALLVGSYAQRWHLGDDAVGGLTATVERWREVLARPGRPRCLPLPHPSWRNNGWLKSRPWFEAELLPVLRAEVARLLAVPQQR
jgi:uracil-DNA glycosylase